MIELRITRDDVTPMLRDLYDCTDPATIVRLAAKSVEVRLRKHFRDRNTEPNERGWRKSGLWRDISKSTAMGAIQGGSGFAWCQISISHPAIFTKLYGATITPKRGKYLAIPATAAAAAAGSPREGATPNLKFAYAPVPAHGRFPGDPSQPGSMRAALQTESATRVVERKRKQGKDTAFGFATQLKEVAEKNAGVWYWLIRSATIHADPDALPPDEDLSDNAMSTINDYLERQKQRVA
jgi:hypothetical protein